MSTFTGYTPCQIQSAYNLNQIKFPNNQLPGTGVNIIIIIPYSNPNLQNDLNIFCKQFSIIPPKLNIIQVKPNTTSNSDWISESCIDTQWISAIAPGANITVLEAFSASNTDLIDALNYAVKLNPDVVSMSWGFPEYQGIQNLNVFKNKNTIYVAASGDSNNIQFPASSPNVIAVSATNVYLNNSNCSYNTEIAWSNSGCGFSSYFHIPSYQSANIPNIKSQYRSISDISIEGGNQTGCVIYNSTSVSNTNNGFGTGSGTSLSTPIMAGIFALVVQLRNNTNKPKLSSALSNGSLCVQNILYSTLKNLSTYNNIFNDITQGSSGQYKTSVGYDNPTGLGTPKGFNFVNYLSNS
jgi:subtilase family serine protease